MVNAHAAGPAQRLDFDAFLGEVEPRLRRALVARFGVELGNESCADAIAFAWERFSVVAPMSNPTGYLYRVGQTAARRHRRLARAPRLPSESPYSAEGSVDLADALERLVPAHRVAVVLVHAHRYSYAEAAAILDIPVTTVRNHVHRGMKQLRRILETP